MTYYRATSPQPSPFVYTNQPDRFRDYNGVELAMTKRYSDRWMANVSFAWNNAIDHWDSPAAYEDPTNIANLQRRSFAPESAGSGIDNVFNNAEWLFKASGLYTPPLWDISLAGTTSLTQGYPFPQADRSVTSRGNGLGDTAASTSTPLGDVRLPNLFIARLPRRQGVHVRRRCASSRAWTSSTSPTRTRSWRAPDAVLANATTGVGSSSTTLPPNNISGIIAPRVIRFGVRVNW